MPEILKVLYLESLARGLSPSVMKEKLRAYAQARYRSDDPRYSQEEMSEFEAADRMMQGKSAEELEAMFAVTEADKAEWGI